jgi:uncharacterized protein YdeI (YjbR/CyaY-like superfamily)
MALTTRAEEHYHAAERTDWRAWLEANHATSPGVWFAYYKQSSGKRRISYAEAVEEALCFAWIDSRQNTFDAERAKLWFSPRKSRSAWSKTNKERVQRPAEQGLMPEAGLKAIEVAKQNGAWSALDAVEELRMPGDLGEALALNDAAQQNFDAFRPSAKKRIFWWIESAKRPDTRAKRIAETVSLAAQNLKAR